MNDTLILDGDLTIDVNIDGEPDNVIAVGRETIDVDSALSTTSINPVQNKIITAEITRLDDRIGEIQTNVNEKADKTVVTQSVNGLMSSADKVKLDGLDNGVSDVQIDGTSIVSDGVAEIPFMSNSNYGVARTDAGYGIGIGVSHQLVVQYASPSVIKAGTGANSLYNPIVPYHQHESTFYGLAKAAGHDEKNSTLPVGQYTEEAKSAIRTMLGLEDVYEDYSSALTALGVIDNG